MDSILAIDPGTTQSAYVRMDSGLIKSFGLMPNENMLDMLRNGSWHGYELAIESVESFGMPVGKEVFETVLWSGRFIEAWDNRDLSWTRIYRKEVKLHLCHSHRAKDSNIWQAIVDRFGGKEAAVGRKAAPGPLFGIHSHCRAALAVGLTFLDTARALDSAAEAGISDHG